MPSEFDEDFTAEDDDLYSADPSHPIPDLDVVDINTVRKGGGSRLTIVIADPLAGDRRSLSRLVEKIGRYMAFTKSPAFVAESGTPTRENTEIVVRIHPGSHADAFEIIEKCRPWVESNDLSLVVNTRLPFLN
jgi:hypothetical protein